MHIITSSSVRSFRTCARLHRYKYIDLVESLVKSDALRLGSLTHLGLNELWRQIMTGERDIDRVMEVIAENEADPFDVVKCQEMLRGYNLRWGIDFEGLYQLDTSSNPLIEGIEQSFDVPIVNPDTGYPMRGMRLHGQVDVKCTGSIVEHKTTSLDITPGSPYWRRLALDNQISNYLIALGVDSCLYDVIRKPSIKPFKETPHEKRKYKADGVLYKTQHDRDETSEEYRVRLQAAIADDPERYYQRGTVVRLESELVEAQHDIYQQAQMIRQSLKADRWPRNSDSCMMYNSECAFFDVCSNTASLDDPTRFKKKETAHTEINNDNDNEKRG